MTKAARKTAITKTKIFKALDRDQLRAFVEQWLSATKPTPKVVSREEAIVMASVPTVTTKGTKNKKRQVIRLEVRYE